MSPRLKGRRREAERVVTELARWAATTGSVRAVAVVGSYGRGTPRLGSDLDLVVLCEDPGRHWLRVVASPPLASADFLVRRPWGALTEWRLRLPSGLHLDVGIASTAWAAADPLDDGTARVLRAGARAVYDPDRLIATASRSATGAVLSNAPLTTRLT